MKLFILILLFPVFIFAQTDNQNQEKKMFLEFNIGLSKPVGEFGSARDYGAWGDEPGYAETGIAYELKYGNFLFDFTLGVPCKFGVLTSIKGGSNPYMNSDVNWNYVGAYAGIFVGINPVKKFHIRINPINVGYLYAHRPKVAFPQYNSTLHSDSGIDVGIFSDISVLYSISNSFDLSVGADFNMSVIEFEYEHDNKPDNYIYDQLISSYGINLGIIYNF